MLKNAMLISLFAISVIAFRGAAVAGIGGWGITITGSALTVDIDLSGVGNPTTKPSIALVDASLTQIQYLCVNPNNFNVAPGSAGDLTLLGVDVLDSGNLVGKGKAVANITFDIPGPFSCVNPNWTFLPESEAAKTIEITISWFACTGDSKVDPDPCFDGNLLTVATEPSDQVTGVCTLDPVQRNTDGTVVLGQVYTCTEIP